MFRAVNDLPGWLEPVAWPFQQLGALFVGPIVAIVALALRRYRLAIAALVVTAAKLLRERAVKAMRQPATAGDVDRPGHRGPRRRPPDGGELRVRARRPGRGLAVGDHAVPQGSLEAGAVGARRGRHGRAGLRRGPQPARRRLRRRPRHRHRRGRQPVVGRRRRRPRGLRPPEPTRRGGWRRPPARRRRAPGRRRRSGSSSRCGLVRMRTRRDRSPEVTLADDAITVGSFDFAESVAAGRGLQPGPRGRRLPGGAGVRPRPARVRRPGAAAGPRRDGPRVRRHGAVFHSLGAAEPTERRRRRPTPSWSRRWPGAPVRCWRARRRRTPTRSSSPRPRPNGSASSRSATSPPSPPELVVRWPARVPDPAALPRRARRRLRRPFARVRRPRRRRPADPSGARRRARRRRPAVHDRSRHRGARPGRAGRRSRPAAGREHHAARAGRARRAAGATSSSTSSTRSRRG